MGHSAFFLWVRPMLTLYTFFRSSAAFRMRIALHYKGLGYEAQYVSLPKAEHLSADYAKLNPQGLVPTLLAGDLILNQSMAMIEYLDETQPGPKLLPGDALQRWRSRSLAQLVACEIHPINNLRVLKYLKSSMNHTQEEIDAWYRHWCHEGLSAYERELNAGPAGVAPGQYSVGDDVSLADVCLVPQIFNAKRFNVDTSPFPETMAIFERLMQLPAFDTSQPSKQADAF
jgi:maleylacetoacetate isomerase